MQFTTVGSTLNGGSNLNENNTHFGIDNLGLVFYKGYENKKLKAFNFGVAINRIANFNRTAEYEGTTPGSIINAFLSSAQGFADADLEPFTSGIAADAGAIFNLEGYYPEEWFSDFDTFEDLAIDRNETITTSGGISDLSLNIGFNISHKLYLGLAASIPVSYTHLTLPTTPYV